MPYQIIVRTSDVMIPLFSGIGIGIDVRAKEKEMESHGIGPDVESIPGLESVPRLELIQ